MNDDELEQSGTADAASTSGLWAQVRESHATEPSGQDRPGEAPEPDAPKEPVPQEAAPQADPGPSSSGTTDDERSRQKAAPDDIWANAPEQLRAAYEAAEHARRSAEGRLSAQQRQLNQFQASVAAQQRREEEERERAAREAGDKLSQLRAEYSELELVFDQLDRSKETEREFKQHATRLQREIDELKGDMAVTRAHPDVHAVIDDPRFADWVRQSADRGAVIQANAEYYAAPADAIELLSQFKAEVYGPSTQPVRPASPNNARRERQLQAGTVVSGRGPGPSATGEGDGLSLLWARTKKKVEAEQGRGERAHL